MKKLYCISDMHGNLNDLELPNDINICIIAGDFSKMTGFGQWHLYNQQKWIQDKFFSWTNKHINTEFVVIPGNHDLCLDESKTFSYKNINWHIDYPKNVHFLKNSGIEINGLKIYGTPNIPIISYSWAFETPHDKLKQIFSKIPENLDILISHSPPKIPGCLLDYSIQTNNGPFGSVELAQEIFNKKPKYVFCGHIHSGDHNLVEFEKSKIYNVSRLDENYEIAYEPMILEI